MEEKTHEIGSSIWPISRLRNLYKFFSLSPNNARNHGFSLIELLVVIGILGILAAGLIALINPIAQTQKAKDGQRKSDLKQIQTGLELYRSGEGSYPAPPLGDSLSASGVDYIKTMPKDPNGGSYNYSTDGSGGYIIYACAENDNSQGAETNASCTNCSGQCFIYTSP